jgi:ribose transport system permease protein
VTTQSHELQASSGVADGAASAAPGGVGPGAPRVALRRRLNPRLLAERYVFVGVWVAMSVVFAIAEPTYFLRSSTIQVITSSGAIYVLLGLGSLCAATVGEFDLSTAFVMSLAATLVPTLVSLDHVNAALAVVIAMAVSVACGALIGVLVVHFRVNSFVTTLGMGTMLVGVAEGISHQAPVDGLSSSFGSLATAHFLGLELIVWYAVALAVFLAYLFAFTPLGRHMLFVGSNPEVARLAGVRVERIRFGAYVAGALIAGFAGVALTAQLGGFQASSGSDYLLPAIAALFMSSIVIRPGRFNPIGVLIAAGFIETGTFGLELVGFSGWTQQVFYGASLVFAIVIVSTVRRQMSGA